MPRKLDKQWYINLASKRLQDFGVCDDSSVWLKNGKNFEILRNVHELKNLIEAEMGKDVASEVEKLIGAANYTERKVNTDLDVYESQLDSFQCNVFRCN